VPNVKSLFSALWKRREPILWVLLVVFVVTMQWPVLKGWYYRATGSAAPATSIAWQTNLSSALSEARAEHKLVVVDFSASWCPPCIAMKHEVWPNPEVATTVNKSFVPVTIDVDHDDGLSDRYNVSGIPAVLVLDPSGRVVRRHDGYLPLDGMLQFLAPGAAN
jgi:thiol:disulfide interchange protein